MAKNLDIKIGRKIYSLSADTSGDEKKLIHAAEMVNKLADQILKSNSQISNDELLMFVAISIAHEYDSLKSQKESDEKMYEQLHNSLAEKIEKLL